MYTLRAGTIAFIFLSVVISGGARAEGGDPVDMPPQMMDPALPDVACDFESWAGQSVAQVEAEVRKTGRPFRILGPGAMATMDFSPVRINIEHDASQMVIRVYCG